VRLRTTITFDIAARDDEAAYEAVKRFLSEHAPLRPNGFAQRNPSLARPNYFTNFLGPRVFAGRHRSTSASWVAGYRIWPPGAAGLLATVDTVRATQK